MSLRERICTSLRGRLAIGLTLGTITVLSLSFVALHHIIRQQIYEHLDDDLRLRMGAVASYAAAHPGAESIGPFMPRFRTGSHEDVFQVWDSQGRTLARSDSATDDLPFLEAAPDAPTYANVTLPDGHRGRAIAQKFVLPVGDPRISITVLTAEETEMFQGLENRIHGLLITVAVMTILAMLLITAYSIRSALRPVNDLARLLESVDLDQPNAVLDTGPLPTELRPVASSFSSLLVRLLEALSREKRYARNVAHELRNPLAEIRLLVDVGSTGTDLDSLRAAVRDIGVTAMEMEQTVDALLALTRYEAGLESPQPEPVDVCAEIRRQARAIGAKAAKRNLSVVLELPAEFWAHTDTVLLRRLLANLMGNAAAHAPSGSEVLVQMSEAGELQLMNPAPHLVAFDVPKLGERFFRIGNGNGGSHAGLGLSLAFAMSKILGLRLELRLREDGCLVATISGLRPLHQAFSTSSAASLDQRDLTGA